MDKQTLDQFLRLDLDTGIFYWKVNLGRNAKVGSKAGVLNGKGYIVIKIQQKNYLAHRLIMLYLEGEMPRKFVDHINGIRNDNRPCNLRHADHSTNGQNMRDARSDNASGFLGVQVRSGRFSAVIRPYKGAKQIWLGSFGTAEEASSVYWDAKKKFHGIEHMRE